jgi:hypothetical protein
MDWAQINVAIATWAVAAFTLWLVRGQLSTAKEQRKLELYLELRKEFDGAQMLSARELLAGQLLDNKPYEEINEAVLNFFEDMGMLLRQNYLDREMIWDTFGYFARMWWSACNDYIAKERAHFGHNTAFFKDFEYLVERITEDDVRKTGKTRVELESSTSAVKRFLQTEALRTTNAKVG